MKIDLKILNNFRNFTIGQEFCIDIIHGELLYVTAPNRFGKTTLLNALRGSLDSLKEVNEKETDGLTPSSRAKAYLECGANVEVSGFDYDEAFFLESVTDDPSSFENSSTAWGLIATGGLSAQKFSKGEKAIYLLARIKDKISKYLAQKYGSIEGWKNSGKSGLVVLDEIDDGLDPQYQMCYNNIIYKLFIEEFNLDAVIVSHSLICPLGKSKKHNYSVMVYKMNGNIKISPEDYFLVESGYKIERVTNS